MPALYRQLLDSRRLMSRESALWEATRPAFRVRPGTAMEVPLYASYGIATGKTARDRLARI
jgi:type IV secretion system T-DNA border endonuclease VirD2